MSGAGWMGAVDAGRGVALGVFAVCLAGVFYLYLGYPALLWALSKLRPRPVRARAITPRVTVIVPAYNEEAVLAAKLDNTLALDYPADRLEVVVVSDGSTDRTEDIARSYSERWDLPTMVRLLALPRGGKARALNAAVEAASGEVLAFTDANALLASGALAALVKPFADSEVGAVCGRKGFRQGLFERGPETVTAGVTADATAEGEGLYWRWDQWQKSLESRIGSVFAADGALYAVRRERYVPIADPAQADDIAISARVVLGGHRLVEASEAWAFEEPPREGREELRRKVRVTNHSVRALLLLGRGLWSHGLYSLELLSHKLLRHLAPFLLIPLFLANLALAPGSPVLAALLAAQTLFYGLALAGFVLRHAAVSRWRVLSIPYYFAMVNVAALLGVLSLLRGERRAVWTPRQGLGP